MIPDPTWLKKAAREMGISVVPKETLEEARRRGCDKPTINLFFNLHQNLMNRDPSLIFNMDETMISFKRKFKVLCLKGNKGLSSSGHIYPHITACVTIGATGKVLKPLFILPNKKTLKGIEELNLNANFASSPSGWMNKRIFTYWALCFLSEILIYRLTLDENLRNERILLIMDGHKSRANFFVAKLFDAFGIDILILPGHTSHLLQPFDVSVASSLKVEYQKNLMAYNVTFDENGLIKSDSKLNQAEVRKMMLLCFLDALHISTKLSNIISGFLNTGIYPINRNMPLKSIFAMEGNDKIYDINPKDSINNMCLNNTKEALTHVYNMDYHQSPSEDDFVLKGEEIEKEVQNLVNKKSEGWALSKMPDLLVGCQNFYEMISIIKKVN